MNNITYSITTLLNDTISKNAPTLIGFIGIIIFAVFAIVAVPKIAWRLAKKLFQK